MQPSPESNPLPKPTETPGLTRTRALTLAGLKQVYSPKAVHQALVDLPVGANEALKSTYEKMIRVGGERFCSKPSCMPDFAVLMDELPNFSEVLEDLRGQLALCLESDDPLRLTPILLLGEPGIGKTYFARRIASMLGTGYGFIPMSSLTAGWVLSGASSQWRNARTGKVFDTLVHGDHANPVMVIDEIDKVSAESHYDPLGALYGLLESDTAKLFTDEFAEVPIDCSEVVWIATANEASRIPEPLLNRMNVYEIAAPDAPGARRIGRSLYRELQAGHHWGSQFPAELDEAALDRLAVLAPREMRRALMQAFGSARLDGRARLCAQDLSTRGVRKQRIGF